MIGPFFVYDTKTDDMRRLLLFAATVLCCACTSVKNVEYVNMFLGTGGDNGQLAPGASVPFGMISVCPDSDPPQHPGYDYDVPRITGVSINRASGIGCSGAGCNVSIRPALPAEPLEIVKSTEKAYPGYYETMFSNGVKGEFTATVNMALERYVYPSDGSRRLMYMDFSSSVVNRPDFVECSYEIFGDNLIKGYVKAPTACRRGSYKLYFNVSLPSFSVIEKEENTVLIEFPQSSGQEVEVRIAVSPVDQRAADEIAAGFSGSSFDQLRRSALSQWEEKLEKIDVKGSTKEQKTLLYTFLYRLYMSPMDVTSNDGRYLGTDGQIYQADGFRYYSSWSMWDTFRTKFPLLAITEPYQMNDICHSVADLFRTGKKGWATPHESVPTVRTEHSGIMLLDCWRKGINDFPLILGYEGMKDEADNDLPMNSPDQKLESSYDLWAISQVAEILGRSDDAALYKAKADSLFEDVWPAEFMNITPDFIKMKDNGLYQGSRWQYRWAAPHCLERMKELAGKEVLNEQLEYFFANGLLNQGNEPCLHIPFIFNMLDNPEATQQVVRDLLVKEDMVHIYGGNAEYPEPFVGRAFQNKVHGLAPEMDEDDGAMSAWYIFCSLGFYPVEVGTDRYEVFSPLYDRIVIDNGQARVVIRTKGRKSLDDKIKRIKVDGKVIDGYTISHTLFRKNTRVVIEY
jgi:putative alpha-1,2-mannosidase